MLCEGVAAGEEAAAGYLSTDGAGVVVRGLDVPPCGGRFDAVVHGGGEAEFNSGERAPNWAGKPAGI